MGEESKGIRHATPSVLEKADGQFRLVVVAGGRVGQTFPLDGPTLTLGRGDDCDIHIAHGKLSWHHAEIHEIGPLEHTVRDLESRNGTFVNGERVRDARPLGMGDKLRLGPDLVLQVSVQDPVEEQLRQRQRFEALGRATAGIAHDFNNLLGAMSSNLGYLQRIPRGTDLKSPTVVECLIDVQSAARRAAELSERLVRFARGERGDDLPIDVGGVVHEVAQLVGRTFARNIAVETSCEPELQVSGDGLEMHQVLMNLCINARDAMPRGGTLTLTATRRGDNAVVIVADTGDGMSPETSARIFEPFFTTKRVGGFGLGLATVREIVQSLHGTITVESEPGVGTSFTVTLPCTAKAVSFLSPNSGVRRRPDGFYRSTPAVRIGAHDGLAKASGANATRLRILIVDDEAAIRRSSRRILEQEGHEVVEASSGEDAIELYASGATPDVVLLDLDMPEMSGEAVLQRLRQLDGNARVVMISGHHQSSVERKLQREGAYALLRKPVRIGTLLDTLRGAAAADDSGVRSHQSGS